MDSKRGVQSQLEIIKREIKLLENEVLKWQSECQTLQETIQILETQLADQQTSFAKEKTSLQETFENRLKEEKQKWEEEQSQILYAPPPISTAFPSPFSASSPIAPFGISSPMSSRPSPRIYKSVSPQPDLNSNRPRISTRTTTYGEVSQHFRRPSRHFESPSTPNLPTITTLEDDDEREFLNNKGGEESPRNTVVDAVSLSASTSTAGPSVNIIERMSAAVRRLESDLASTKEELTRSIKQRDEAREECVKLMVEVEEKRRFQETAEQTQHRYDDLENRFDTTAGRN